MQRALLGERRVGSTIPIVPAMPGVGRIFKNENQHFFSSSGCRGETLSRSLFTSPLESKVFFIQAWLRVPEVGL